MLRALTPVTPDPLITDNRALKRPMPPAMPRSGLLQQPHVTALVGGLRQHLADRRLQPGMVVVGDELDAMQTAFA